MLCVNRSRGYISTVRGRSLRKKRIVRHLHLGVVKRSKGRLRRVKGYRKSSGLGLKRFTGKWLSIGGRERGK